MRTRRLILTPMPHVAFSKKHSCLSKPRIPAKPVSTAALSEPEMIPLRTQVKFFLTTAEGVANADGIDLAAFAPVFQRWIQQKSVEGQFVDVADYRHVFEGPSIVLIGHDSD